MAGEIGTDAEKPRSKEALALVVLIFSIVAISALGITIVCTKAEGAQTVMNAVLPLFGSWVGTILAYYFSKENLAAATDSVARMARQLTPQEKLQQTPARDKMIPKDKIHFESVTAATPAAQIKLMDVLSRLVAANKGWRIPFFNGDGVPLYVIHRSLIDKFLTDNAISAAPLDPATLTIQDLLNNPEMKGKADRSFSTVREDATLADAKAAMEARGDCQDVFLTKGGQDNEAVIGWITNVILEENSKV
jgi:hypothetical protein